MRRVDRKKRAAVVDNAIDVAAEAPSTLSGTSSVFGLGLLNLEYKTLDVSNAPTYAASHPNFSGLGAFYAARFGGCLSSIFLDKI